MDSSINKTLIIKGNITTREHYLRNDLFCHSKLCTQCPHKTPLLDLIPQQQHQHQQQQHQQHAVDDAMVETVDYNKDVHYVVPSVDVALRYVDLFADTLADSALRNIVFCETHCKYMQAYRKLYDRMKRMLQTAKETEHGSCVLFCNEHHKSTFVQRRQRESFEERDQRAMVVVAAWYRTHLNHRVPIVLLALHEEEREALQMMANAVGNEGVIVETIDRYVRSRFAQNSAVLDQFDVLTASVVLPLTSDEVEFEDHLPQNVLEAGAASGRFLRGVIQVNKFRTRQATVNIKARPKYESEQVEDDLLLRHVIVIDGLVHRNRAIHGDVVYVQLLPEIDWVSESSKGRKKSTATNDEGIIDQEAKLIPTARVVGIARRGTRSFVASIQQEKIGESGTTTSRIKSEHVLCIPLDKRIPKIRIKTRQRAQLENSRIVVRISDWEKTSMYPDGYYVESLGEIGDLETETKALLMEHKLLDNSLPFSKLALSELPAHSSEHQFKIPKEEFLKRRDIRFSHLVMSVDPIGCEDIDDALSVRELKNGNLEFAVHIADVTYFVKQDSHLDLEARKRALSIYLVDRRLDMLPVLLSGDLCSLHMGRDRLTFSIFWEMTRRGEVVKVDFARAIVRSKYALHYDQAQNIIDGKTAPPVEPTGNWRECTVLEEDHANVKKSLTLLQEYAMIIRERRMKGGALKLESLEEVDFKLARDDKETMKPTQIITKHHLLIHETIEEWMIFANSSAARKIYNSFPSNSVLRIHPFPRQEGFEQLRAIAAIRGFEIKTDSNSALAASLEAAKDPRDEFVNPLLRSLATRAMQSAQYICTDHSQPSDFYHYGLALDFYTHFTSPIRRYADILVHRMLLRAMELNVQRTAAVKHSVVNSNTNILSSDALTEICNDINEKKTASDKAQMDSMEWFRAIYFRERVCVEDAIIYSIRKDQLFVFVSKFSLKGSIHMTTKEGDIIIAEDDAKDLEGMNCEPDISFDEDNLEMTVSIIKQQRRQRHKHSFKFNLFDHVTVRLTIKESRAHLPQAQIILKSFKRNQHVDSLGLQAPRVPATKLYADQFESMKLQKEKDADEQIYDIVSNRMPEYEQHEVTLYSMLKGLKIREKKQAQKMDSMDNFDVDVSSEVSEDVNTHRVAREVKLMEDKHELERRLRKIVRLKSRKDESQWTPRERARVHQEESYRNRLREVESQLQYRSATAR